MATFEDGSMKRRLELANSRRIFRDYKGAGVSWNALDESV